MNRLTVLAVLGWHPLAHTHANTHYNQMWFPHPRCICICCRVASGIYRGFTFPEVWSYFHDHVGNQVTTRVLRWLSVKTSQFVTCFNITGQKRHKRNVVGCLNICAGWQIISAIWVFNDQITAHNQELTIHLLNYAAQFNFLHSKYNKNLHVFFFILTFLLSQSCKM